MGSAMLSPGDVLSHHQMCAVEGRGLQQGMSFRTRHSHSIILMSQRKGAPYPDRMSDDGKTLIYIGHDAYGDPRKNVIDQPLATPQGTLTQNGHFYSAAVQSKASGIPEYVRVYEKLHMGVWVFNGLFELVGARMESDGTRQVCVFELRLVESNLPVGGEGAGSSRRVGVEGSGVNPLEEEATQISLSPGRLIPSDVKLAVYKRDKGVCAICGTKQDLHFDHILPWSKGGSSTNAENIQLLCQRHNLEKSARIL